MKKLYRYDNILTGSSHCPYYEYFCTTYYIQKETPTGYWISLENYKFEIPNRFNCRFMQKDCKRLYAHENKVTALSMFIERKKRQMGILNAKVNRLKRMLEKIEGKKTL